MILSNCGCGVVVVDRERWLLFVRRPSAALVRGEPWLAVQGVIAWEELGGNTEA